MMNLQTLEDEIVIFTEREIRLKALLHVIDNHIGCSNDYEGMVDERELSFDEIKIIVIQSLESYILDEDITQMTDIENYLDYIKRVENI